MKLTPEQTALAQRYIKTLKARMMKQYPLPGEAEFHDLIDRFRALRESDESMLRPTDWSRGHDGRRAYLIDPLGERIPYVWADLLYSEDPVIAPANKADADLMDAMVNDNRLTSELHRAEWIKSSEGEVWYRIQPNELRQHAQIEFLSRKSVTPLWSGRDLAAAAFVAKIGVPPSKGKFYRYLEIHSHGVVSRSLFLATDKGSGLGEEIPLDTIPETDGWEAETQTETGILAGRLVNKLGANRKFGVSDYDGLEDLLETLNMATTIGRENMSLTAKQRAIIPQRFLDMFGNLPQDAQILVATDVDTDPDKIKNDVAMVEFTFDAEALTTYMDYTQDTVLTRARVAPQLVGRHTEGAQTGPALKARIIDSELGAAGKGKSWDDEMPVALDRMVDVERAMGVAWKKPGKKDHKLPSFKRSSALPEDPESRSRRLALAVNADFLSRRSAIQIDHPEWDEGRVDAEMTQIEKESKMGLTIPGPDTSTSTPGQDPPGGDPPDDNEPPKPETGGGKKERSNANR